VHASKVMGPHIPLQARGLVEASYAASTWARHASAMNCLEKFGYIRGVKIMYPVQLEILCDFVSWALLEKGLKADTVKAYLSSINVAHNFRGLNSHCSNVIITSMLKGAKNMSLYEGLARGTRKVMSYPLMRLLQHQIFNSEWLDDSKLVVWAASLTAYFGSFRLGEILPKSENYNVEETLMWGDVKFDSYLLYTRLKLKQKSALYSKILKVLNKSL